jgi:hypothetical protein
MRLAMLVPWFGPLPPWFDLYMERVEAQTIDFIFDHDLRSFKQRVEDILGVRCPIVEGGAKIHDYRCAFGLLYQDELVGYDWWGHTDMDCIYGRLDRFYSDERLAEPLLILTDCNDYVCGPWTLYRNTEETRLLFMDVPGWERELTRRKVTGWVETSFTETTRAHLRHRLRLDQRHRYGDPHRLAWNGDRLMDGTVEIPFFHFNRTKVWPEIICV